MTGQGALDFVILTLRRLSREGHKFEASPGYTAKTLSHKQTKPHTTVLACSYFWQVACRPFLCLSGFNFNLKKIN